MTHAHESFKELCRLAREKDYGVGLRCTPRGKDAVGPNRPLPVVDGIQILSSGSKVVKFRATTLDRLDVDSAHLLHDMGWDREAA